MSDTIETTVPEAVVGRRLSRSGGELEVRDSDDGRIVYGRMFPIGEVAHIREEFEGQILDYDEQFLPRCTQRVRQIVQTRLSGKPAFLRLWLGHEERFDREIGSCVELDEQGDGVYTTFRLYQSDDLPKVRSMLREAYSGLSVQFSDFIPPTIEGRLVSRRQINPHHCAATPMPQYASAGIISMRAADELPSDTPNLDRVRAMLEELRA